MNRQLVKRIAASVFVLLGMLQSANAQYQGWQHSGPLTILTTPEGANLPAGTVVEGFPLLVRLDKDWFDFGKAKPFGEDIRFTAAGARCRIRSRSGMPQKGRRASGAHPEDRGQYPADDPHALGQGGCGERVEREGGVQRLERLRQRLAHGRSGGG